MAMTKEQFKLSIMRDIVRADSNDERTKMIFDAIESKIFDASALSVNLNEKDGDGNTFVHFIAMNADISKPFSKENGQCLQSFMQNGGANITMYNFDGYAPIHCAIECNNIAFALWLLYVDHQIFRQKTLPQMMMIKIRKEQQKMQQQQQQQSQQLQQQLQQYEFPKPQTILDLAKQYNRHELVKHFERLFYIGRETQSDTLCKKYLIAELCKIWDVSHYDEPS
jgi:hypothetical protein